MTADVLALIDTYATGMQIAMWGWGISLFILHLLAAAGLYLICRAACHRIHASFTRAHHTIADIQQPRKETQS